jgi:protein-S-isoprenylcysteine O-methyltransferase Ste14
MRRGSALLGSFVFLLIAPGFVAGVVPFWITRWELHPPLLGIAAIRIVGVAMILAGAPVVLDSFVRFALQGLGTPAPILPPRHLVVTGLYRHVRNPMYVGILAVVLGQALLFGSVLAFEYALFLWCAFHLFVLLYEEPKLRSLFGDEYRDFCKQVPRWIPRWIPRWKPRSEGPASGQTLP